MTTTHVPTLLQRNVEAMERHQALTIRPEMNTVILSCLDARSDPAHFVGLQPGDALVIRNAGGRVTEDVEHHLALLGALANKMGGPLFELVVVHHTDCGMERIADPDARGALRKASGVPGPLLDRLAIRDRDTSLREDVERLQQSAVVPAGLKVTAMTYDHETGAAQEVFTEVIGA